MPIGHVDQQAGPLPQNVMQMEVLSPASSSPPCRCVQASDFRSIADPVSLPPGRSHLHPGREGQILWVLLHSLASVSISDQITIQQFLPWDLHKNLYFDKVPYQSPPLQLLKKQLKLKQHMGNLAIANLAILIAFPQRRI